uniref:Uncharacterized protein n=1 Tax=Pithovirus LCPAC202 TaxID=2506592 RepID=A0A481Z605_9VIRU|nr:MAG: uncharacterized protein LCPAC202_00100 [Pithovirus LCPAC202]
MDAIIAIIIVIVAFLIILCINAFFIYLPGQRIKRKVDGVEKKIGGLITTIDTNLEPLLKMSAEDFITLVESTTRFETKVNETIEAFGCTYCLITGPEDRMKFCDGNFLKPISL